MRKIAKFLLVLFVVYLLFLTGFYAAMRQRPEVFSSVMARLPGVVFLVLPFEKLWLSARQGSLRVGDEAPDFSLETYDKTARVQLSDLRDERPVVLVFGSYT